MAYLSNILNKFNITKFVVGDANSPYTSIQTAIDDAHMAFLASSKSQVVYVKSGLYTEDLTFLPGVIVEGAHSPSAFDYKRLLNPVDIDYNFGVFIIGTHNIDAATDFGNLSVDGDYNIKNIYFLSKGFGTSGVFTSSIIDFINDGENYTLNCRIIIENCKFATGYEPTDTSGPVFNCTDTSGTGQYSYSTVVFNDCSFYCPSPASSGEYTDTYNAFHLIGGDSTSYSFNNCEFDATNDGEAQYTMYTCVRVRNLYSSPWQTTFQGCRFTNFTIAVAEEGASEQGNTYINLYNCTIPVITTHFFYFANKCPVLKVENCLVNLGEAVFTSENSNAFPEDFSSVGTIFKRAGTTYQLSGSQINGGTSSSNWLVENAKVMDSYPPLYTVFSDSTTQVAAAINHAYPIEFNTNESGSGSGMIPGGAGVYVDNDNQATPKPTLITMDAAGIYNIQFSIQFERTSGSGTDTVCVFLRKNGTTHSANVERSATYISLVGNAAKVLAAWNFVVAAEEGDSYQLMWTTPNTDIKLVAVAAVAGTAPNYYDKIPAAPSIILTVTKIK